MAHIVEDRILESTTTTGVGDLTLVGAILGFRRFNAVCAVGDTVPYFIEGVDSVGLPTGEFEYGVGTYTAADTLKRTKVDGSSNSGALVNFTAGSKNVGIPALASALVPTGARMEFLGNVVPPGYLELDGSLKSRLQYPALWAYAQASGILAAGDAGWAFEKGKFSPGDGATTFRLPDHRGLHARTWDHGAGVDTGRAIGSIQADAMLQHTHTATASVSDPGHAHPLDGQTIQGSGSAAPSAVTDGNARGLGTVTGTAGTGITVGVTVNAASGASETRVKNVAVLVCVKT